MPSISEKKVKYEERLCACLSKYSRILFVGMQNVRSQQVHDVRAALRGKAEFIMGKKTLQAKIISKRADSDDASSMDRSFNSQCENSSLLTGNTGLIFTNEEVNVIIEILDRFRVKAPARVGAISPCEVIIPAGNTGMEPTQTSFFQALNIATKIAKGTVEIVSDKKVLSTGDKVDNSTATLLQKLNISPFFYQVEVLSVWDRGVLFSSADLKITDSTLEEMLISGISNLSAISLGAGIPTPATIGSMVVDAFKNLLGVSVATSYEFDEFNGKQLREAALSGTLAGPAAGAGAESAAVAPPAASAAAATASESEDSEEDFGFGGLF